MSGRRLPSLEAYLATLPEGIESYPECQSKASILRHALQLGLPDDAEMPAVLRAVLADPPPVTAWVPEVYQNALVLSLYDIHFSGDLDAFENWVLERNRQVFASALYRALFFVVSPERLVRGVGRRWGTFRRGSKLYVEERGPKAVTVHVVSPPHLQSRLSLRALGVSFRAALEAAGATGVRAELAAMTSTEGSYRLGWR